MPYDSPSPPTDSSITDLTKDPKTGQMVDSHMVSSAWIQYFFAQNDRIDKTARTVGSASTGGPVSGNLAPQQFLPPPKDKGLYRISYYARITRPAGVSSSLQVELRWVDGGTPMSYLGPAMTGNLSTTMQANSILVQCDANAPVSYGTLYVSNPASGATSMQYSISATLEAM